MKISYIKIFYQDIMSIKDRICRLYNELWLGRNNQATEFQLESLRSRTHEYFRKNMNRLSTPMG